MLKSDCRAFRGCRAPRPGEIMTNPKLADTFNVLANEGKRGFYTGRIAEAIISVCQDLGARLELEDLKRHMDIGSQTVTPISLKFRGHVVGKLPVQNNINNILTMGKEMTIMVASKFGNTPQMARE